MAQQSRKTNRARTNAAPRPVFTAPVLWVALGLVLVNVIVYGQVWHHNFVNFDDPDYVYQNPFVTAGLTWQGFVWALTSNVQANWHPLTWLSHMLDAQIYGLNAAGHHLTNVLFHIANSLMLFWLFFRTTEALGRSAFVAAVFAVHPLHVESVAWVSERKDVLSTFLGILAVWAYFIYVRQPRLGRYALVALLFAFALMAKPMMVTLPFVLLLLDFWPLRRIPEFTPRAVVPLIYEKLPLFLFTVASSIVTFIVQQHARATAAFEVLPLTFRAANAVIAYFQYLAKILWPAGLAPFYPYPYSAPNVVMVLLAASALLLSSFWAIKVANRYPYIPVGWFWFLGTLVPVIGIVQVGSQAMADRYTYFPLIGLLLVVAWGVPEILRQISYREHLLGAASGLAVLLCIITAHRQVEYWKDSTAMWGRALEVTHDNYMAHFGLGIALGESGKHEDALAHLQEALRLNPEYTPAYYNLGMEFAQLGKLDEATTEFSRAIQRDPADAGAHNNLANIFMAKGKLDEATAEYHAALQISPDYLDARSNLASLLLKQGKLDAAMHEASEVLRTDPFHANALQIVDQLKKRGIH